MGIRVAEDLVAPFRDPKRSRARANKPFESFFAKLRPVPPLSTGLHPMFLAWIPFFLVLLPTALLGAQDIKKNRPFIDEPSTEREGVVEPEYWKERGFELPPYPQEADLIELRLDAPSSRFRYFIDSANLRIGTDQVVRYTLVIRSQTGSENVAVEGVRCDSPQYKVYAYGVRGGFKAVSGSDWQRIGPSDADVAQRELQRYYLCQPSHYKPRPPTEMIFALKGQVHLRDTGFIPD